MNVGLTAVQLRELAEVLASRVDGDVSKRAPRSAGKHLATSNAK